MFLWYINSGLLILLQQNTLYEKIQTKSSFLATIINFMTWWHHFNWMNLKFIKRQLNFFIIKNVKFSSAPNRLFNYFLNNWMCLLLFWDSNTFLKTSKCKFTHLKQANSYNICWSNEISPFETKEHPQCTPTYQQVYCETIFYFASTCC